MEDKGGSVSLAFKNYVCGFAAGAANIVSGYPFDALKVRLQSSATNSKHGMWKVGAHAFRNEGAAWLFRGCSAPALGTGLETGINYLVFEEVYHRHLKVKAEDGLKTIVTGSLFAGACVGVPVSLVLTPIELIKVRTQMSHTLKMGSTPREAVKFIMKKDGYRGFGRGLSATLVREIPGNAIFFAVYNGVQKVFPNEGSSSRSSSIGSTLFCGGLSGCAFWLCIFPADVVKTRMQITSNRNKSFLGEMSTIAKQKGLKGLYAGITPTLIRAFPANAIQWLAWDLTSKWLNTTG